MTATLSRPLSTSLFDLVSPARTALPESRAERLYLACIAFLAALASAAIWGVAAGSGGGRLALGNVIGVPVLVAASSLASLPLGLFVWKLTSGSGRATDLVLAHSVGLGTGAATLLLLSPIVALYQVSSSFAGPLVALATALLAFAVGTLVLVRVLGKVSHAKGFVLPVVLLVITQVASLAQLSALMPPVLHERTRFGHGVDTLIHRAPQAEVVAPSSPEATP